MRALDGEIIEECSEYLMAFLLQTPCMLYDGFNKQAPRVVTSVSPDLPHPCARCIHLSTFSLAEVPLVECDIHIARFPDTIGLCFARHEKEPS